MCLRAWCRWAAAAASWLMFVSLAIGADPAHARAESLAVLGLTSEDGDDGLATSITQAVRSAAQEQGSYDVSSSHVSLAQMTMAQDCEITDAQCRIAVADALKSERVI